jgi:hypothetical protein
MVLVPSLNSIRLWQLSARVETPPNNSFNRTRHSAALKFDVNGSPVNSGVRHLLNVNETEEQKMLCGSQKKLCIEVIFLISLLPLLLVAPYPGSAKKTSRPSFQSSTQDPALQVSSPTSIVVLLDISTSLETLTSLKSRLSKSQKKALLLSDAQKKTALFQALSHFVRLSNQQNEYSIITISTVPEFVLDSSKNPHAVLEQLDKLAGSRREGATALYDACYMGINKVARGLYSKRAVLLVGDGVDSLSNRPLEEVLRLSREKKVPIYAVNIGDPNNKTDTTYEKGRRILEAVATSSGGSTYNPGSPEELNAVFESIATKLRGL